jgi:signal transduction histidine kinase
VARVSIVAKAGLAAAFAVAFAAEAVGIAQTWGIRSWLAGGAAALIAAALAVVRREHRVGTALAGFAVAGLAIAGARVFHLPTEPGPALALAVAVLVGSAVRALPPVPAGGLAAGGLAVVVAADLAARPDSSGAPAVVAMNAVAWLGAVATGLALRMQDDRAAAAAERVRREERLDLARELHDVVAHHITGMLIQAQAANLVAQKDPQQVTASLAGIETAGTEALRAMRRLVGVLRDGDDGPPASAGPEELGVLVERFTRQGPPVRLRVPDGTGWPPSAWPPEVASTVYRIVREALTNVARHAPDAGGVTITVEQDPSGVTVEVLDDAPPGPARSGYRGGYGLVGLRERVETLGGTLHAGPAAGQGWAVRATVPVHSGSSS